MSGCNMKMPDIVNVRGPGSPKMSNITIAQPSQKELQVTKVIYNCKGKTEKQIKDSIQLEIDTFLIHWPDYKFVNSNSHFNGMGGIEMTLYFELK
jgi:hypothetical protein